MVGQDGSVSATTADVTLRGKIVGNKFTGTGTSATCSYEFDMAKV